MKISTRGRYAVRLMIELAEAKKEEFTSLSVVSEKLDVSLKYLEQIASGLTKGGLLESSRGIKGGYRLAKNPEDYTIRDILLVTEGDLSPLPCLGSKDCHRVDACATVGMWQGLYDTITEYLGGITVLDLMKER
ncbi:MAG: RrF2 family transcriptional regulator [Anaerovoracaceae bacterium]|jgi:Rrf2 family protein